jgi:hypothetical protein
MILLGRKIVLISLSIDLVAFNMRPLRIWSRTDSYRVCVRGNIASMPSWWVGASDDLHHSTSDHAKGLPQTLMWSVKDLRGSTA